MNEDNNYTLTDEEQDRLYPLSEVEKKQWQTWVPTGYKITNMQIYDAMSRGIPIPNGDPKHDQEYCMFLQEHDLLKKEEITKPIIDIDDRIIPKKKPTKKHGHKISAFITSLFRKKGDVEKTSARNYGINSDNGITSSESSLNNNEAIPEDEIGLNNDNDTPVANIESVVKDPIINEEEIARALNEYLNSDTEDVLVKIVERFKYFVLPILLAALLALLGTCFRITESVNKNPVLVEKAMSYVLTHTESQNYEEALRAAMDQICMGDQVELSDGQRFNTNSAMTGITKELGKEFSAEEKYAGKYPITGFSIVRKSDKKVLAYIEDFYTPSNSTKLSTFVEEALANHDFNIEDVSIEFHFGRTDKEAGERSRLGWLEDGNLVLNEDEIRKSVEESITYKGIIENFQGDHITITTNEGEVKIPIKDAAGNLYKPGEKVVGSDNKVYEISELNETTTHNEPTMGETKSTNISFSLKNAKLAATLPFVLMALLDYIIKKRKNAIAEDNPYFKLMSNGELQQYVEEFQGARTKIYKEHKGEIYSEDVFQQLIMEAYTEMTGIKVENIEQLGYDVEVDSILVYNIDNPGNKVDITEYIINKTGQSIGTGWDSEAEDSFRDRKGRR